MKKEFTILIFYTALTLGGGYFLGAGAGCATLSPVEKQTAKESSLSALTIACMQAQSDGKAGANMLFCREVLDQAVNKNKFTNFERCVNMAERLKKTLDCERITGMK